MTYVIGEPGLDVLERACVDVPDRNAPLGSTGGTAKLGALDVDTQIVASHPEVGCRAGVVYEDVG